MTFCEQAGVIEQCDRSPAISALEQFFGLGAPMRLPKSFLGAYTSVALARVDSETCYCLPGTSNRPRQGKVASRCYLVLPDGILQKLQ